MPLLSSDPGAGMRASTRLLSSTARTSSGTGLCISTNSPLGSCLMMPDS